MKKQILLFGFGPFLKVKSNISKKILGGFSFPNIKKRILPVKYDKKMIIKKLFDNKNKPDYVLGLGQHYSGNLLRIERKAQNLFWEKIRVNKKECLATGIIQKTPEKYNLNLKLPKKEFSRISYDAGFYVCNYAMYIIMDYIKKKKLKTKFAFIHIPPKYPVLKARKQLNEYLTNIK